MHTSVFVNYVAYGEMRRTNYIPTKPSEKQQNIIIWLSSIDGYDYC